MKPLCLIVALGVISSANADTVDMLCSVPV